MSVLEPAQLVKSLGLPAGPSELKAFCFLQAQLLLGSILDGEAPFSADVLAKANDKMKRLQRAIIEDLTQSGADGGDVAAAEVATKAVEISRKVIESDERDVLVTEYGMKDLKEPWEEIPAALRNENYGLLLSSGHKARRKEARAWVSKVFGNLSHLQATGTGERLYLYCPEHALCQKRPGCMCFVRISVDKEVYRVETKGEYCFYRDHISETSGRRDLGSLSRASGNDVASDNGLEAATFMLNELDLCSGAADPSSKVPFVVDTPLHQGGNAPSTSQAPVRAEVLATEARCAT